MTYSMMFMRSFFFCFLHESLCCGYSDAIQMGTHNKCLYKEVDEKYTGCNMKTPKLLDCALIGLCVVIRPNTVTTNSFDPD